MCDDIRGWPVLKAKIIKKFHFTSLSNICGMPAVFWVLFLAEDTKVNATHC